MSAQPANDNTYEEEIEVEVEDDGNEGAYEEYEEVVEEEEEAAPPAAPVTPSKKPGKVNPSKEVAAMQMRSPASAAKSPGAGLSPEKNPFPSFGDWTAKNIQQIEVDVPLLNSKHETTNELTRATKPENRYWKAPIMFRYSSFSNDVIRFNNVPIPFHTGKGYGSKFIYLCLPAFVGERIAEAGKTKRPTRVSEKSLVPDKNRWWKVANSVEDRFGTFNRTTGMFNKKSLETVFDSTGAGITANVLLKFYFKAATEDADPLKPTTTGTIGVELVRGYISAMDVQVQPPNRVIRNKVGVEPGATSKDVATDDLMKRLGELGL